MDEMRFCIVTVVKNNLNGLRETRLSIEQQNYRNWRHIIIDGDSTDGTKEYLGHLDSQNTLWLSEPDYGIYNAMNKSLSFIENDEYVFFLNAEDVFANEDSLKIASDNLSSNKSNDWGCTTHEEIEFNGEGWICKLVSPPTLQNQLYAIGYRSHQGVIIKKSMIVKLGGFDETLKIAADWDLIAKCIMTSSPVIWKESLARFKLGGFSSSRIIEAHKELAVLRSRYLPKKFSTPIYDYFWSLIYTPIDISSQNTSLKDKSQVFLKSLFSFLVHQNTQNDNGKRHYVTLVKIYKYLKSNLFKQLQFTDFKQKESRLNNLKVYRNCKYIFLDRIILLSNGIDKINPLSKKFNKKYGRFSMVHCVNANTFIQFLHKRLGIAPFQ